MAAAGESELPVEAESAPQETQRGILFTGERVNELLAEQLVAIGDFASRMYGVEMRVIDDVREFGRVAVTNAENAEEEKPEPVPITREDFIAFAVEHDFGRNLAGKAWAWVERIARGQQDSRDPTSRIDDLPRIEVLGHEADLLTIYAHVHAAMQRLDEFSGGPHRDRFLIALLNDRLQPERPLPSR